MGVDVVRECTLSVLQNGALQNHEAHIRCARLPPIAKPQGCPAKIGLHSAGSKTARAARVTWLDAPSVDKNRRAS
jgi:hypothetical protein